MKIGFLIDSGASLREEQLNGTDIHTIPLHVILEDKTEFLDSPENIENNKVYERIKNGEAVSTSMASPGELMVKYEEMLKTYEHIIHLTITPNLSGMHNVAIQVANDEEFEGKVTIIEHNLAANAITYLTLKMNDMAKNGVTDPAEFQKLATSVDDKVFLGLIPGDVSRLAKGGRGKSVLIAFLKLLRTKIMVQWGEKPKKAGVARSISGLIEKAIPLAKKSAGKECKWILVHTPVASARSIDSAKKVLDDAGITYEVQLIPNIYGCHAGDETMGLIAIPHEILL